MTAPGTDWRKAGRDAAHEDAACEGAVPCTTLDSARTRCAAWLEDVEGADVEAAAAGYLAGWAAHLRDAADTSAPLLDLDAIEARFTDAACEVGDSAAWRSADDVPALMARVRDLEAEARRLRSMISAETAAHRADLRDDARALDDLVAEVWRALGETHEPPADVVTLLARVAAARREGAEAMRDALVSALDAMVHAEATEAEFFRLTRDEDSAAEHHHKRAVLLETRVTALSLQLPEVTP